MARRRYVTPLEAAFEARNLPNDMVIFPASASPYVGQCARAAMIDGGYLVTLLNQTAMLERHVYICDISDAAAEYGHMECLWCGDELDYHPTREPDHAATHPDH